MTEPMPDQTPEPITDDELRTAAMHGRIAHDASSERQTLWGEFAARASVELLAARDWAAWFAAERDELARQRAFELEAIAERQRMYRDRIAAEEHRAGEMTRLAIALQESGAALRAHITELETERDNLTAELRDTAAGFRRALDRVEQLEAPAGEPHAYIAVKRRFSIHADQPEWEWDAAVIPAGEHHAWDRDDHVKRGYELLPIVGTETGTRPATPQSDPAGYVVVTRNSEGGVHRSATVWDSLDQARTAEGVQAGYADGTGCTAAVYELREVQQ